MSQPDDKTDDIVDMSSTLQHVEPTSNPLVSYGHTASLVEEMKYMTSKKSMKWYKTGNLSAHLVCFLMYSELNVRHLCVLAVLDIKYYFVGMALFVSSTCKAGHENKFC